MINPPLCCHIVITAIHTDQAGLRSVHRMNHIEVFARSQAMWCVQWFVHVEMSCHALQGDRHRGYIEERTYVGWNGRMDASRIIFEYVRYLDEFLVFDHERPFAGVLWHQIQLDAQIAHSVFRVIHFFKKMSKRRATGMARPSKEIQRWLKDSNGLEDCVVDIPDDSAMHKWDVFFPAVMFDATDDQSEDKFEVAADVGWIPLRSDLNIVYSNLQVAAATLGPGTTCYQVGNMWYEASIQENGTMVQTNVATDMKRPVRKIDPSLGAQIREWFNMHGKGRKPGIHLKMVLPENFPSSPPFVRVVCPRFKFQTGHVTVGGSICTAFLTLTEWIPNITLSGFMRQVQVLFGEGGAKIDVSIPWDYTEREAEEAFTRMLHTHSDWKM